ncbi:dihydrofolate reductase family protein [Oryzibacter oryziterrae]|uniref:dihydrofolate reductase family protein n=1 Tax=Oryzibacter oryziterrae TaxID=2766474 RepID=UPI001F2FC022|nr:dihydrofolate reductase family protein [Oryzibacter oryziterrae]
MAKLVFGMNMSLDGYVDHTAFAPGPELFRHFIEQVKGLAGGLYGRKIYDLMRYWDEDQDDWGDAERDFAEAWRALPKWVASRSLTEVGPNATLVSGELDDFVRKLKADRDGTIDVAGTRLAHSLVPSGLIDAYHLYIHPVVLGSGTPLFAGPRPPLRLVATEQMDANVVRLSYVPA